MAVLVVVAHCLSRRPQLGSPGCCCFALLRGSCFACVNPRCRPEKQTLVLLTQGDLCYLVSQGCKNTMGAWHAFLLMLLLLPLVFHTVHTHAGDFVSLAALGGPAIGIKQALLQVIT